MISPNRFLCALALVVCLAGPGIADIRFLRAGGSFTADAGAYRATIARGIFHYSSRDAQQPDLTYTLSEVTIAGAPIPLDTSPVVSAAGDTVRCDYGDHVCETYTATPDGIEQCWIIGDCPGEPGEIVIRGRLHSPHSFTCGDRGIAFTSRRGLPVFRYGLVTAIDARGKACTFAPRIEQGGLTITVPRAFVESAEFPILVDPVVGPEVPLCPSFSSAADSQENVDMSLGQDGYFAVWQDKRSGADMDIFGSRISTTGEVLDKMGISISTAAGNQTDPAVAWNGRQYLVVWMDRGTPDSHIYCARLQPDGQVLDKQGILLSGTTGRQAFPDVASDGSSWLVVWQHQSTGSSDIYGCKVGGDGVVSRVYSIATGAGDEDQPAVAWNGSSYLVAWRDNRNLGTTGTDIYACRVARNGVRLPGDALVSCVTNISTAAPGDQRSPQLCGFGTYVMAVWEDTRTGTSAIRGSRIDSTPKSIDVGGISIPDSTGGQEFPSVGYDGSKLLVTWRSMYDMLVRGSRLDTAGKVLDSTGRSISSGRANTTGTCVVGTGSKFLVAWSNLNPGISDVLFTPVSDGGTVTYPAGYIASLALDDQRTYAVADNGSEYAVVWCQSANGGSCVMGARLSHAGELLTPTPVNITVGYAGSEYDPAITWNGSNYVLAWTADNGYGLDIKGCRLRSDLSSLDVLPINICTAAEDQAKPCIAASGTTCLVVWEDSRNAISPNYYTDLYGALVSSSGSVTPMAAGVSVATGDQRNPKAASSGSGYLVVWEDYRSNYPRVYGTRVSTAGQVQDTAGIAFPATSYYQTGPAVCFGGGNYMVAWSDWYSITGCRVSTAGAIQDPAGIAISGGNTKYCPSVCWDGGKYRVVWEDYRSSYAGNADVYYTTVSSAGAVSSDPQMALVSDLVPQLKPQILSSASTGLLLYSRYVNFANGTQACSLTDQQVQDVSTVGAAKRLPPGTLMSVRGKVVSGAFSGFFYIQEPDRSSGIKVISSVPVTKGDVVDVTGTLTVSDGERQINSSILSLLGTTGVPRPLGVRGDALGGGALNGYTPGITAGIGTNNVGLLVTTWGKVTVQGSDYFIIESRPGLPIKIKSGTLQKPAVGKTVSVTGICTCDVQSGVIGRAVLPRQQSDLRTLN